MNDKTESWITTNNCCSNCGSKLTNAESQNLRKAVEKAHYALSLFRCVRDQMLSRTPSTEAFDSAMRALEELSQPQNHP